MKIANALFITALCALPCSSYAEPANNIIKITNGINQTDFTGDGVSDLIISGHRENNSAHSFEVVSFFVPDKNTLNIVPIFAQGKETFEVSVSGGADCLLHDFRLLKGSAEEPATLIVAEREFGHSFADSEKVTFVFYTLKHNGHTAIEEAWGPTFSFVPSKVEVAQRNYCDVGDAFKSELGLGSR